MTMTRGGAGSVPDGRDTVTLLRSASRLDCAARIPSQPVFWTWSLPLDLQAQEMRGAGDARIVVAHGLLALPRQLIPRKVQIGRDKFPQVALNGLLVLRCWRDDLGIADHSLLVQLVAVVQDAARRLGTAVAGAGTRFDLHRRCLRNLELVDDAQCFVAGVNGLDAAHDDALERVAAG